MSAMQALRQFFRWTIQEDGEIAGEPHGEHEAADDPRRAGPGAGGRDEDIKKLLKVCDGKEFEQRHDTAILRTVR